MANCSNEFPSTDVFYEEIGSDAATIVLLVLGSILVALSVGMFVEELIFLQRLHYKDEAKMKKLATILGLFPVTIITAFIALIVPKSTILVDLIASCYLSVCFYTFVTLLIDYFGGDNVMISTFSGTRIRLHTPPCCCCCCCILKPVPLTRKSLIVFKLMSLQVAVIRPLLLFVAAVLWTDGRYSRTVGSTGNTSYTYITVITMISTLFSLYGTIVIVRASAPFLKDFRVGMKFASFQLVLILINIQNLLFTILARYDLPECIGSRGPIVRGSNFHHSLLIIETFLLGLVARRGYRVDERTAQLSAFSDNTHDDSVDTPATEFSVNMETDDASTNTNENGAGDQWSKTYSNGGLDNSS